MPLNENEKNGALALGKPWRGRAVVDDYALRRGDGKTARAEDIPRGVGTSSSLTALNRADGGTRAGVGEPRGSGC